MKKCWVGPRPESLAYKYQKLSFVKWLPMQKLSMWGMVGYEMKLISLKNMQPKLSIQKIEFA
jgi:hypothetical protein